MSWGAQDVSGPHVLVIVENLPIQVDRRVQLEVQELVARGYRVSLICPKDDGDPARQDFLGARVFRYRPAPPANGLPGFMLEFGYCWLRTALLSLLVRWERGRIDVIQACNPPDTYWLLAWLWRFAGVRFIFDHHDLNPELFLSRFGRATSWLKKLEFAGLKWLERRTFQTADRVISTNDSYRNIAVRRGHRHPDDVNVVRSGPDTARMRPIYPDDPVPEGITMLAYLGIMGPQDDVDHVLLLVDELVHKRGRTDIRATLMGFGDCLDELRATCSEMGLADIVTFTGQVGKKEIAEGLSRAHIGVAPDRATPLNDVSTMNKTLEYMAYALPSVAFDLTETKVTGGDAVRYVPSGDVSAMADEVENLIANPELRAELSILSRQRVVELFDWRGQAMVFGSVFDVVTGFHSKPVDRTVSTSAVDEFGRTYVPLDDESEFARFVAERRAP